MAFYSRLKLNIRHQENVSRKTTEAEDAYLRVIRAVVPGLGGRRLVGRSLRRRRWGSRGGGFVRWWRLERDEQDKSAHITQRHTTVAKLELSKSRRSAAEPVPDDLGLHSKHPG